MQKHKIMKTKTFQYLLIIAGLIRTVSAEAQNCINCDGATVTGLSASAIGYNAVASGDYSLAFGNGAHAGSLRAISIGNSSLANAWSSFAIGNLVSSTNLNSFTLGMGCSASNPLVNNIQNSLCVGFNSNLPTLFIGGSSGAGTTGKVGIGTANPSEKLSVNGVVESVNGGFRFPDGSVQNTRALDPWKEAGSNAICFPSGMVGIGTQSPTAQLDVYGDIVLGKPGNNFILHSRPWIGDALIIAPQNNYGGWDWSKSFTLKDNGQVFIGGEMAVGSQHMGYKLAVNGKVVTKEVVVTIQDWADGVFDPSYPLTKITDLEQFIIKNGHLPGVPPQHEVLSTGLALGQMDKMLLTKVEELTLYVINLQKEIQKLQSENSEKVSY